MVLEVMARVQDGLLRRLVSRWLRCRMRWLGGMIRRRGLIVCLELLMLMMLEHLLLLRGVLLEQIDIHFACGREQVLEGIDTVFAD